jgi:hypothetical protein
MRAQFGRVARVAVENQPLVYSGFSTSISDETPGAPVSPRLPASRSESEFTGLHVQFKVEKTPGMVPNTADISIRNLADSSRRRLKTVGALITLEAGRPDGIGLVFKGNARTIDHVRKGADWVTHIQCGDGETAYRYAQANQSFKSGTPFKDAATYLAEQMGGIDVSAFVQKIGSGEIAGAFTQFVNGVTLFGNAGEELERLMAAAGYQLSIQNHELTALKLTQTSSVVVTLSPASGLIGSPEHGTPEKSGLPSILKAKCFLETRIRPGDRVNFEGIEDDRITGDYRTFKVTHTGDTEAVDWYTDLELRPASVRQ